MSTLARPTTARELMKEWQVALALRTSVPVAGRLLGTSGAAAAPVVDAGGRCVGLFTEGDYRRWLGDRPHPEDGLERSRDEVRGHMTRRFGAASPEAGVREMLRRLSTVAEPFLVVLDHRMRPLGVVYGLDVLAAESKTGSALWSQGGVSS